MKIKNPLDRKRVCGRNHVLRWVSLCCLVSQNSASSHYYKGGAHSTRPSASSSSLMGDESSLDSYHHSEFTTSTATSNGINSIHPLSFPYDAEYYESVLEDMEEEERILRALAKLEEEEPHRRAALDKPEIPPSSLPHLTPPVRTGLDDGNATKRKRTPKRQTQRSKKSLQSAAKNRSSANQKAHQALESPRPQHMKERKLTGQRSASPDTRECVSAKENAEASSLAVSSSVTAQTRHYISGHAHSSTNHHLPATSSLSSTQTAEKNAATRTAWSTAPAASSPHIVSSPPSGFVPSNSRPSNRQPPSPRQTIHKPNTPPRSTSNSSPTLPKVPTPPTRTTTPATTSNSNTTPWIRKFLASRSRDVLFPIPKEYLSDGFNLAQLGPVVERIGFQAMGANAVEIAQQLMQMKGQPSYPIYRLALQRILNEDDEGAISHQQHPLIGPQIVQAAAEALYLLVHARFAASPRGLEALRRVLLASSSSSSSSMPVFGRCPRAACNGSPLLPYGVSNDYSSNHSKCQRYCPNCGETWKFWESKTDGCAWGPSLAHLLLLAHGNELLFNKLASTTKGSRHHGANGPNAVHSVFGFQIHPATTWGRPLMEAEASNSPAATTAGAFGGASNM